MTIETDLTNTLGDGPFDVEVQDELGFTFPPIIETFEESVDKEDEGMYVTLLFPKMTLTHLEPKCTCLKYLI